MSAARSCCSSPRSWATISWTPTPSCVTHNGRAAWTPTTKEPEDRTEPDVKGVAGGRDEYYGLLERTTEETSVLDNPSALAAARSKLRGSTPTPVVVDTSQETTLAPDAAVDVASLVPGWCVDVTTTTTCRGISQSLKIQGLTVKEDADGESVAVQLFPAGV